MNNGLNFFVWTSRPKNTSACYYYRIDVPMEEMSKMNYISYYLDTGENDKESKLARLYSDVAHHYAVGGEEALHDILSLRKVKSAMREGREIYPPVIVYDIDDNNDFVHPFNTYPFAHMGIRGYPDARLLKPGEGLEIVDSKGEQIGAWVDQETVSNGKVFDVARNLHTMKVRHELIRACHGVTVPSPTLAKYMKNVIGAKDVYVFPNTVVLQDYDRTRAVRENPDEIRILWQGGMSHWIDWYPLRDALRTISQKYPQVKWVIFGSWFNWIHENIPDEQVEHHPWTTYDGYRIKRGLLNIDINLCPLVNNVFNACKSEIKYLEGSIWEKPEATLAAVSPTYDMIVDGEHGLKYTTPEEFVEKLSILIENAELRKKLGANAKKWTLENRTPQSTIPGLFDFYTELRAKQKRELGKPLIKKPSFEEIKKLASPLSR